MKTPSDRIDERELAHVLGEDWGLVAGRLSYRAVGFGDHHWELLDASGRRWFVTVADLARGWRGADPAAGYADLRASMDTVTLLGQAGLEFAVAPVPTTDGHSLAPLGATHAVTVFPFLAGEDGDFGDTLPECERLALIDVLARLHDATPLARGRAPIRAPDIAGRPALEAALDNLGEPWTGGPYSERARHLLAEHATPLRTVLADFDELVCATAARGPTVLTHGEPHPGNILRGPGTLRLIDWDTVGVALPERDLWDVAGGDGRAAERYAELTGRRLSRDAMVMYRTRWSLDDICLSVAEFRGPHAQTADTETAWLCLCEETDAVLDLA